MTSKLRLQNKVAIVTELDLRPLGSAAAGISPGDRGHRLGHWLRGFISGLGRSPIHYRRCPSGGRRRYRYQCPEIDLRQRTGGRKG